MSIPITRTKRSIPKSRDSTSASKERVQVHPHPHPSSIKHSNDYHKISFMNPFAISNDRDGSKKVRLVNPVEYISPRTTSPRSPPNSRILSSVLRLPPSPKDTKQHNESYTESVSRLNGPAQRRCEQEGHGGISKPRRLSKEEVDIQLLSGKSVLSTHMTVNGIMIIEKRFNTKLKGCLPCYEKQKGNEKIELVIPSLSSE